MSAVPSDRFDGWDAPHAAAGVVGDDGAVLATWGDTGRASRWASVTKLATALTVLVAAEEGTVGLDEPAGPPGATGRVPTRVSAENALGKSSAAT